jgi:hypothetical protein
VPSAMCREGRDTGFGVGGSGQGKGRFEIQNSRKG